MHNKQIVVATTNKRKLKEIEAIFSDFDIVSAKELGYSEDIIENGKTFEENALIKAKAISKHFNTICIADDSGICIDYLDGFPGIQTARFLSGTDRERNLYILEKMKDVPKEKRKVTFRVSIALATPTFSFTVSKDLCGYISLAPRGNNGFGFDEIFELEDGKTLAELSFEEKNKISNRKKALEAIKKYLCK